MLQSQQLGMCIEHERLAWQLLKVTIFANPSTTPQGFMHSPLFGEFLLIFEHLPESLFGEFRSISYSLMCVRRDCVSSQQMFR